MFYLISCLADIYYVHAGKVEFKDGDLVCVNGKFILVSDGKGSIALLVYTLVCYAYALMMLFIFYYLPKRSGLVMDIMTLSGD